MSDALQVTWVEVTVFVVIVLAIFILPFFVWRVRSKKRAEAYDDEWQDRARKRTPPAF